MQVPVHAGWHDATPKDTGRKGAVEHEPEVTLAGCRVFVVEDEAVVRLDLVEMLRDAGAVVVGEAGSLGEGLKKAEDLSIDVAVLDRNLNGESSLLLAHFLARRGTPIVFVSGYDAGSTGSWESEDQPTYLQKPISPDALVTALAIALRRSRERKPYRTD
jgi:DNA-binding response OmpR family regulator